MSLGKANLDHITIVLNRPKHSENIGSTARAMKNMGLKHLLVIDPERYNKETVLRLATHAAADVVEGIIIEKELKSALSGFQYVAGTTARLGSQRQAILQPSEFAQKLAAFSTENRIALVFGPEDRGLTNEELRLCHALINIPTADFSSINLAQAVMICCYEIFKASQTPIASFAPRLATRHELDGMYDQLKDILVKINYIQPDNPDYWMNKMRLFFSRLPLKAREVSIIRGICRQIIWYGEKKYQDGNAVKNRNSSVK
ncbi:MAG: RNA methyltransferase [Desulfobacterales bacterium]|jgi:tRNA/rRNA methyltransferase|nr:RNA methyltransferase [Desulfobacterales bacterium]